MRRFCDVHAALPLLDVLGGGGILLHQNVEGVLLIAFIGQLSQRQRDLMHRDVDVGFEDVDVLLGRGQLRLDLRDLVFIGAAIELEQRLALFHPIIVLDQHLGDERRAGQSRDELDGVLNHRGVGGVRRHEPEADHEYEHDVNHEKRENESPARRQPQQFELEENKPEDRGGGNEDQDRRHHGVLSSPVGVSGASADAAGLPFRRAIMARVSRRSSRGRLRISMMSVGLKAQISA